MTFTPDEVVRLANALRVLARAGSIPDEIVVGAKTAETRTLLTDAARYIESTLRVNVVSARDVVIHDVSHIKIDGKKSFAPFLGLDRDDATMRDMVRMMVGLALATTGDNTDWHRTLEGDDEPPPVLLTAQEEAQLDAAITAAKGKGDTGDTRLSRLADALPEGRMRTALRVFVLRERGVHAVMQQSLSDFMAVPLVDDSTTTKERE